MFGKRKAKRKRLAEQERIRQEEIKREAERCIRLHAGGLAEEMNLRLFFKMGEKNTLWVDSVTVTKVIFPEYEKHQKKKWRKGFICRLQNSFRDYRWTT